MNAEILRRVVRAIHIGSQPDLDRLASKIVDNERRTGHMRLADELQAILNRSLQRATGLPLSASSRAGRSCSTVLLDAASHLVPNGWPGRPGCRY